MRVKATCAILLVFCCTVFVMADEKSALSFSLDEVLSIGDFEDNVLFQWIGIAVDGEGNIYVTDGMDYSLKKFSHRGLFIRKSGQRGEGPGEFMAPRLLGCSEKYVYVTDQSLLGIHVYDHDLNYLDRIPFRHPVGDLKVFPDGRVAVAAYTLQQSGKIIVFNEKGGVLKEYRYTEKRGPVMMDWVTFEIDSRGDLYVVYSFQDLIEKFDASGNKIWSMSLLGIGQVKRKQVGPWKVPQSLVYKDVALDMQGRLYILGGGHSENPSRDVYVLNSGGEHLTTFSLPEKTHCIHVDQWDCLYSRSNEGITMKKFRILTRSTPN